MSIEMNPPFNVLEICNAFNIRIDDFTKLVQKSTAQQSDKATDIAVAEVIPKFLSWFEGNVKNGRMSARTLKLYQTYLHKLLIFIGKNYINLTVTQLNEDLVYEFLQLYQAKKGGTKLSPYTINNVIAIVRSLIKYCFKQKLISTDFRHDFEWVKTKPLPKYLNPEELDRLLKASLQLINGYRSYTILSFLAGTGARIGEVLDLQIGDVNFEERYVFIKNGKGNKSRHIPLDTTVRDILIDYLNITGVKQITPGMTGYIFSKDFGENRPTNLTREAVETMFRKLREKLELNSSFRVHSLRHTFAVNCLRNGMPLHVLQQILGHEDPQTTGIYTKLFPKDILEELNRYFPFQFGKLMLQSIDEEHVDESDL